MGRLELLLLYNDFGWVIFTQLRSRIDTSLRFLVLGELISFMKNLEMDRKFAGPVSLMFQYSFLLIIGNHSDKQYIT